MFKHLLWRAYLWMLGINPPKRRRRVFIDLDGPTVDYDAYKTANPGLSIKDHPTAYRDMLPTPGAIEAIRALIGMGYDVFIATRPCHGRPHTYSAKVEWVMFYLPELTRKIILTHDKGLLGSEHDVLIDDMPHKANCSTYLGTFLHYREGLGWPEILAYLKTSSRHSFVTDWRQPLRIV